MADYQNQERNQLIIDRYRSGVKLKDIERELGVKRGVIAGVVNRARAANRGGSKLPFTDITGQRFHMLVVVERAPNGPFGATQWDCLCDCGKRITMQGGHLGKKQKSCGCWQREVNDRWRERRQEMVRLRKQGFKLREIAENFETTVDAVIQVMIRENATAPRMARAA